MLKEPIKKLFKIYPGLESNKKEKNHFDSSIMYSFKSRLSQFQVT